jgi:diguanylate cyclase (GGDEF)-like protein/PAS domain S-box-containing protein
VTCSGTCRSGSRFRSASAPRCRSTCSAGGHYWWSYAVSALQHIRWTGSRAWLPALGWSLVGILLGQLAIAAGLIFTYLTPLQTQVGGLAGAILVALLVRQYGLETAHREQTEEALHRSEQRFRALVQYSSDMTVVLDPDGTVTYVSPAVQEMLGRAPEELIGTVLNDLSPDDLGVETLWGSARQADNKSVIRSEVRFVHADGSIRWHHVTVRNLLDTSAVGALVANHRDVTEERQAKERLAYEASHDLLTGLDNRGAFVRHLQAALRDGRSQDRAVAVLFIDLDGFKRVNDTLGHEAGDEVLSAVAGVLRRHVLATDVIGRLGGDEFAVALPRIESPDNAAAVARRILAGLAEPVQVAGHNLVLGASVGICLALPDAEPVGAADLLRRADLAMYHAKRSRGPRWELYSPELEPASRISADEIRTAAAEDQLFLAYQPIVALEDGRVVGAEALVRWNHPTRGLVLPSDFIPIAEENGLIRLVGEWVLRTAGAQLADWRAVVPDADDLWLSVNMAADQLEDPQTDRLVRSVLETTAIPSDRLVVEVTESALADSAAARATLEALHEAGVRIAIDDFGTGYSSLQYLTRLPVDILKLDRAFVDELDGTPEGSAIADAVVRLAQTLHLRTTAEGVETEAQAAELVALGYTTAQGYLYSRPVSPQGLAAMLTHPSGPAARAAHSDAAIPPPRTARRTAAAPASAGGSARETGR